MKGIKICIALIVIGFFSFTVVDIYKAFFIEESPTSIEGEPIKEVNSNQVIIPKETPKPTDKTSEPLPPPTPTPENPSTSKTPNEKDVDKTHSDLQVSLDTANLINNLIISQSITEIDHLDNYIQRKVNKIGMSSHLDKSLRTKQEAFATLTLSEKAFIDSGSGELYAVTKQRLLESISFTKTAQSHLHEGRGKELIPNHLYAYVQTDTGIQKEQVQILVEILEKNNITHSLNEVTNSVDYSL